MTETTCDLARRAWRERSDPVLVKPLEGRLKVRLPEEHLRWPFPVKPKEHAPRRNSQDGCWELPRKRFNTLIEEILPVWRKMYVAQYFIDQKRCAPMCRQAKGFDCECTCGGEFHGVDGPPGGWVDISDTFSVFTGESYLSCRVLTQKAPPPR